jgi:hypothetical protein
MTYCETPKLAFQNHVNLLVMAFLATFLAPCAPLSSKRLNKARTVDFCGFAAGGFWTGEFRSDFLDPWFQFQIASGSNFVDQRSKKHLL